MNARSVNSAAGVVQAAMEQGRQTATGIALALDSAGLLMSPETAAELERLTARVSELEAQRERRRVRLVALQNDALNMRGTLSPNGEDNKVPFTLGETLTPAVEWLINRVAELEAERHTTNQALADMTVAQRAEESADKLTALFAPTQALRVEASAPGACDACGDLPERWCPDCAACKAGCYDGHVDNPCSHANAPWGGAR